MIVAFLTWNPVGGQIKVPTPLDDGFGVIGLDDYFESYSFADIHITNLKGTIRGRRVHLTLPNGDDVQVILSRSDLLADSYDALIHLSGGVTISSKELYTPMEGYIMGIPSSTARLTIADSYVYGYIRSGKKKYYIEPAVRFDKNMQSDMMIIYTEDQIKKKNNGIICAASEAKIQTGRIGPNLKSSGSCQVAELAIAMDYGYLQNHGTATAAINQSIAVMNMVAGSYEDAFNDDIRFEIVQHYVSSCTACDPWSATTDANTLLSEFSSWAPQGFSKRHDIGQLWTSRNICGNGNCSVAGLAWINSVCGSNRYHILEDFTSTAWQLRVLVAHEIGHNFGANHDASGSQDIMAPSIATNTATWSSTSISVINNALTGFDCFEDCVIGSCTEIVSISTSGCTPGSPATYDLHLEVRHGGGGASTGFDVIVGGQAYSQGWSSSPQSVVISGLVADGQSDIDVTLAAHDGSDTGCAGTDTYDAPPGDCALRVTEDFSDCALPDNWGEASTNTFTWNNGDPLVQYKWKFDDATRQFGNYDDHSNASSLKTIDGTCMAVMDDDIINHSLYTGDVTLTSPIYNVSDYDTLQLRFDYNFHPFEDGGKGANNSFFKVEVFDGGSWVTILMDTESDCPWHNVWQPNCTDQIDMDVSSYINDAFRVRFVYGDGQDGKWTGMAALDNIEILGTVTSGSTGPTCTDGIQNGDETGIDCGGSCDPCEDPCLPIVVVTSVNGESGNAFEARDLIRTSGVISVDQLTSFAADTHEINVDFQVMPGASFSLISEGCED